MPLASTFFTLFAPLVALYGLHVHAQATDAVCMDSFSWATNSLKQSPCKVASYLLGQCTENAHVDALPEGSHYGGPTSVSSSTSCQCSTVTFSLLSACGACQNRTLESWSVYSAHCSYVYVGEYPEELPSETAVQGWAYLDVKAKDGFDLDLAKQNANITESIRPKPAPSITSFSSSSDVASTSVFSSDPVTTTTTAPSIPQTIEYSPSKSRAIIGGICGGTAGVIVLMLGAFYFKRRRDQQRLESRLEALGSEPSNTSGSSVEKVAP